jgi:CubicO group peptidase (beta-lactamase class C family)
MMRGMNKTGSTFVARSLVLASFLAAAVLPTQAADLTRAPSAEKVGMSSARLERLRTVLREDVERGRAPGVVAIVLRRGQIVTFDAFGRRDIEQGAPMTKDAIFRIASQSKAVTSVAAMILYEEGRLLLSDPVSKYIPAFKETKVAIPVPPDSPALDKYLLAQPRRPITIRDLLTHMSGYSYGNGPAEEEYKAAGLSGWFFADKDETIAQAVERLAKLPTDAQPGEKYIYGYSTDILGAVVEKVSGLSLSDFFQQRIFTPLKMRDTCFFLPPEKVARLTAVYGMRETGKLELVESPEKNAYVTGPRKCFSGGAGLLSTALDYARFLEALRRGGELEGARILSPKSVELMTVDQTGGKYSDGGFGLGFGITQDLGLRGQLGTVGAYRWGGAYHSTYWVDPKEELVAVLLTQLRPAGDSDLHGKFTALVYQSIVDSKSFR